MSPIKEQTSFVYKTDASAGDIPAIVHYKPSFSQAATPRPVVMIIHGGGYTVCGAFIVPRAQIEALLDMGFVVVTPEYRLCPQVSVAEGPVADSLACLAWIRAELPGLLRARTGVAVDAGRVAAMGHSAGGNLALLMGAAPQPPRAIFDVYGTIDPGDAFYRAPQAAFAGVPAVDAAFAAGVYDGPVPLSAPPMFRDGRPDLSTPRNAWMITSLKDGSHTAKVVKDGDYDAVSGAKALRSGFPPTVILHGTKDVFAPYGHSAAAVQRLNELGVESKLITVPDQDHMFDIPITKDDPLFRYIQEGLDFLRKHV